MTTLHNRKRMKSAASRVANGSRTMKTFSNFSSTMNKGNFNILSKDSIPSRQQSPSSYAKTSALATVKN